jgi:hypothetical protein
MLAEDLDVDLVSRTDISNILYTNAIDPVGGNMREYMLGLQPDLS